MEVLDFGLEVVAVSASGVLAPGPLFVTNMLYGAKGSAASGVKMAHGHALVEVCVVTALAAGLFSAAALISGYSNVIALVGGAAILGFAVLQVAGVIKQKELEPSGKHRHGPVVAGMLMTGLNPFFLIWWSTVGLKLVSDSTSFGLAAGVMMLFFMHVWMDYVWLAATAYLASRGTMILQSRYYRMLVLGLVAFLVYYGVQFILSAAK